MIPFALVHGVWTKRASHDLTHLKATHSEMGFPGNHAIWVTGTLSSKALTQLAVAGFTAKENVDKHYGFLDYILSCGRNVRRS